MMMIVVKQLKHNGKCYYCKKTLKFGDPVLVADSRVYCSKLCCSYALSRDNLKKG